jgi:hypothetical protein
VSRYHIARHTDGDGWILFKLDALGSSEATIIGARMTEKHARRRLAWYRSAEGAQS